MICFCSKSQIRPRRNDFAAILVCTFILAASAFLFCSCATSPRAFTAVPASELPPAQRINKEAGRGSHLIATVQLATGEDLPLVVDTGSPVTIFDKSIEHLLGKRIGTMPIHNVDGTSQTAGILKAPRLFIEDTPLKLDARVYSMDFGRSPMGILGTDCLQHYCVQLDFEASEWRFLDPNHVESTNDLGNAYPLSVQSGYAFIQTPDLFGRGTNVMVDVGCNIDGLASRETIDGLAVLLGHQNWNGESYSNLVLAAVGKVPAIGLRFLARHLVTFDFPNQTLYLKKRRSDPLPGDFALERARLGDLKSPLKFIEALSMANQLPGGIHSRRPNTIFLEAASNPAPGGSREVTFAFGDLDRIARHHYTVLQVSNAWQLTKAWRTDEHEAIVEEFSLP